MRRMLCLCLARIAVVALRANLHAQATSDPGSDPRPATEERSAGALLRTYVNLVQMPVLVLQGNKHPMPPVESARFRVSIDSGPFFAPRHVRREGDDPLHLQVLVDESSLSKETLAGTAEALSRLDSSVLMPQDKLSLAASYGCVLIDNSDPAHAPGGLAKVAQHVLLRAPLEQVPLVSRKRCGKRSHLWDGMVSAMMKLKGDPGRKVLVVIASGDDEGSRATPLQVQQLATQLSVSVFAIRRDRLQREAYASLAIGGFPTSNFGREGDPLATVAESSGGMVLEDHHQPLGDALVQLVATIRDRYIVDFVRPTSIEGRHSITVSVGDPHAFIRVGGTTVPLPGESETNDPDRVPDDHSNEPPVGRRRILR